MMYRKKKCLECGKEFTPISGGQKYCKGPHHTKCEYCGKNIKYTCSPKEKPRFCSTKCRESWKREYNLKNYGVENVSQRLDISKKISDVKSGKKSKSQYVPKITYRKCDWCGKEFQTNGTQRFCKGPHYATCVICGNQFEVNPVQPRKTCSSECKSELRKRSIKQVKHKCKICGKIFYSSSNTSKYCEGPHYSPCPICGNPVEFHSLTDPTSCCSVECSKELRRRTSLATYGTPVPSQNADVRKTLKMKSILSKDQRESTCLNRYGVKNVAMSDEVKSKISKTVSSAECQSRIEQTSLERYGYHHSSQSPEIRSRVRKNQYDIFSSDGTRVDSNYEKQVYDFLLKAGISFSYQSDTIEYEYQGKIHSTIIDFRIGDLLFEVKGGHLMNGCFDYQGVPIDVKLDVYRKHHVIVITDELARSKFGKPNSSESNGLKYLNKCPNPLIGIDINLFDANCPFPYREDRPHCFYDVKVDGQKSAHEAFYDLNIRWKMILNRIMYSGGFIDAKQVLNALNITRTCKQPSWFSKQLAKDIIMKYCSSDTIVDPFAGWGARADACNELHRNYIGVDFNEELINWHHEKGRTNIMYGDATYFKYDGNCSVFICPPYSDPETGRCFEDYNFDGFDEKAKALSQCDWMRIVMRNVPNASEYILVCKIVDEGWDVFIVDTKKNRSHFGLNNEYILCISNEDSKQLIL